MATVQQLYIGALRTLEPEGELTGIYKHPVETASVTSNGIVGDHQADPRYHGGPEKALHQYAVHSYTRIQETYPDLKHIAVPGSMGENISSSELTDESVCIGDIYRAGNTILQVSRPRSPCWKINHKFDTDSLSLFVERQAITGWYYRVIQTGDINIGDSIKLEERFNENISIQKFVTISKSHRPAVHDLDELISCQHLNLEMKQSLQSRREYLVGLQK